MLTTGQMIASDGEMKQNPYIMSQGCAMMLEVVGPMISEEVEITTPEGKTKKMTLKGIDTPKYNLYKRALAESRELIQYGMDPRMANRHELLNRAYQILGALKEELLQKASQYELDFRAKPSVHDAWLE
jgi:hypothetical protein